MSCPIEIKAINRLKQDGVIDNTRKINNLDRFNELNSKYTEAMVDIYGLQPGNDFLFLVEGKQIKLPTGNSYLRDNISTIYRAVPNSNLFNELQDIIDDNTIQESQEPVQISIKFPEMSDIVNSENPIEMKREIDRLQNDKDELDNLMNCTWGS